MSHVLDTGRDTWHFTRFVTEYRIRWKWVRLPRQSLSTHLSRFDTLNINLILVNGRLSYFLIFDFIMAELKVVTTDNRVISSK